MARTDREFKPLEPLKRIPFVRNLRYIAAPDTLDNGYIGTLNFQTPTGRVRLLAESKRSLLTRSAVNQFLAWVKRPENGKPRQAILLARHISVPVAERLIEAKVNFADDAGNIHLVLGDRYNWTFVGKPALEPASARRPISAAQLQLLFQFVTHPDSVNWSVRQLELAAGISKSKAAQARPQLVAEGMLVRKGKGYRLGPTNQLLEHLASGYAQVLRPKLVVGRFRFAEKTAELFLERLAGMVPGVRYALTGGPAADILQRYYRGPEVPMFLEMPSLLVARKLRLLPDSEGPVTILRAFGDLVFWQKRDRHMLAPPPLIYAELLNHSDPRAHEAAQELRRELPL